MKVSLKAYLILAIFNQLLTQKQIHEIKPLKNQIYRNEKNL